MFSELTSYMEIVPPRGMKSISRGGEVLLIFGKDGRTRELKEIHSDISDIWGTFIFI